MNNKERIALEKRIVRYALTTAQDAGWKVHSVFDGGEFVKANSIEDAINTIFSVDESTVRFRNAELKAASLLIVLGNGYDVLTDYSYSPNMKSFADAMTKSEDYVNSLQAKGTMTNPRKKKLSQAEMLKNPASNEAHELLLFIVNDRELYRQRTQPIILNLRRKIKRGIYNPELAMKLWRYLADAGAKKYNHEYIGLRRGIQLENKGYGIWTVPIRNEVARELSAYYSDEVNMNKNPGTLRATRKMKSRLHSRTHFDTGNVKQKTVSVQQQRGAMWFTLAVAQNTDKGRKLAQQWALRYHRKHPGTKLRLFI